MNADLDLAKLRALAEAARDYQPTQADLDDDNNPALAELQLAFTPTAALTLLDAYAALQRRHEALLRMDDGA